MNPSTNNVTMPHHTFSLLAEIKNLENGWAGPKSVAPTDAIVDKLSEVFNALALTEEETPEVQIDDDGSVTLY